MTLIGIKPLMTAFVALLHPFFISVVDINHNEKDASLEISVRTFTDDLEKMIDREYNVKLDLAQANQKEKANALINQYIQKRLALTTNGVKSNIEFIGFEIKQESTWSYFEVKNIQQLKQLKIFCEILFGIDKQQINIIHVKTNGVRKSFELASPNNTTQFLF
jgi:hypothetical protein